MDKEFDPLDYHTIADTVVKALLKQPKKKLALGGTFSGAGVYLIYYQGEFEAYENISGTTTPVYVGKAIPSGGRKGASALRQLEQTGTPALFNRIRDHWQSIDAARNLDVEDFRCRYLVVTQIWISVAESLLIERFHPVWNSAVDGFGLHDPGKTRYSQKKSDWDTLHPGRHWEPKMSPGKSTREILAAIEDHFSAT